MKLVEIKCKNCGSLLKVEEGATTVTCEYCHTSYALDDEAQHIKYDNMYESGYEFEKGRMKAQEEENEEINEQVNEQMKSTSKLGSFIMTIFVIIFIIAFVGIGYIFFKGFMSTSNSINSHRTEFEKNSFNSTFEMYSGTNNKFFVEHLLDEVVTNNKKNTFHIITVEFNNTSTSDPNEIVNIKQALKEDPTQYEIGFDYSDGFIYKMVITEIQ